MKKDLFYINRSRSRLSAFNFIGNNKPPFAHSPSSPIHPNHNGGISHLPNDLRSQIHQKVYFKILSSNQTNSIHYLDWSISIAQSTKIFSIFKSYWL